MGQVALELVGVGGRGHGLLLIGRLAHHVTRRAAEGVVDAASAAQPPGCRSRKTAHVDRLNLVFRIKYFNFKNFIS